jgi:predicted MFS family arabinose efflux permease
MALTSLTAPENSFRALWGRPQYPSFLLTVSLSRTTASMFNTAGVLLILLRTGSAPLAGITAAAAVVPAAVTGPALGAWLDMARRRRLLIVFDQLMSVVGLVAIVLLAGHAANWTVPAVTVIYSVTRPLTQGSFFSSLAVVSGPELLDRASAIEATSLNLAVVAGPILAGTLAGIIGPAETVELQAALTVVVAALVAVNPVFDLGRAEDRPQSLSHALRTGLRAMARQRVIVITTFTGCLASCSWGLMLVGFPLYAAQRLHTAPHASGYLWAAVGAGSILGTFGLHGRPSLRRVGLSYAALGLSALAWPLAGSLVAGVALILFTGFLEGPAYSGTIALRQRYAPLSARAQVMTTVTSIQQLTLSAGAAIGGAVHRPDALIAIFVAINLVAAVAALSRRSVSLS